MPKITRGLTEKQKNFCREYVNNKGNGIEAYLFAYDSSSKSAAAIESSKLLRRDDITEYIATLNKPLENRIQNEREKKRQWLWDMIDNPNIDESNRLRAMDILNKMDAEYVNITRNEESKTDISKLDIDTLSKLVGKPSN